MSGEDEDSAEKSHEPTQKKLDDARRKGEIPKSVDLTTAAAYGGFMLVILAAGTPSLLSIGSTLAGFLGQADSLSIDWFDDSAEPLSLNAANELAWPTLIWFLVPALAAVLALIAQRGIVFAPEKIQPKLNRLSLIANAKNKFGRSGLFEFFKSFVKLSIFSVALTLHLWWRLPEIISSVQMPPKIALAILGQLTVEFFAIVLIVSGVMGAIDFIFQYQEHMRKNRMSRKELSDEMKHTEGDPHMKQQRRQKAYDIATNKMLSDVPTADVVIVNPQHYAVALKWSRATGSAPVCVAKGLDEIAHRIREIAAEAAVPIHSDPPTARALHATVEIGEEILPDQYKAVAAAIRFAELMRAKARARV